MEAAEVGPLVSVEREDGEQRGHSLSVIPRERHPERYAEKAAKHSFPWIVSLSPSLVRSCRLTGRACGQGGHWCWRAKQSRLQLLCLHSSNVQTQTC